VRKVAYVMKPCQSDLYGSCIGSSLAQPINEGISLNAGRPLWVGSRLLLTQRAADKRTACQLPKCWMNESKHTVSTRIVP
jgi:hypothetical protein